MQVYYWLSSQLWISSFWPLNYYCSTFSSCALLMLINQIFKELSLKLILVSTLLKSSFNTCFLELKMIESDSTVIPLIDLGLRFITVALHIDKKRREISLLLIKLLNIMNENSFSDNSASVTVLLNWKNQIN